MNEVQNEIEKAIGLKKSSTTNGDDTVEKRAVRFEPGEANGMTMYPKNPCIITSGNSDSPIAEEYRKLKTVILRMTRDEFRNTGHGDQLGQRRGEKPHECKPCHHDGKGIRTNGTAGRC